MLGTRGRERLATSALNGVCKFGICLFVIFVFGCLLFDTSYFVTVLHCHLFKSKKAYVAFIITRALD